MGYRLVQALISVKLSLTVLLILTWEVSWAVEDLHLAQTVDSLIRLVLTAWAVFHNINRQEYTLEI